MQLNLSPKYLMELTKKVVNELLSLYKHDDDSQIFYLKRWQGESLLGHRASNDFHIGYDEYNRFKLDQTINNIPGETLVKIAIDLGLDVPGVIPYVPQFKIDLQPNYANAHKMFSEAYKKAVTEPDLSVGLANSALESILKEVLRSIDEDTFKEFEKDTTTKLIKEVLKKFKLFPYQGLTNELRNIAEGLNGTCSAIDNFRSRYSSFHGKAEAQEFVNDPIYAYFIVNSVAAIGGFVISYYEKHVKDVKQEIVKG